ncbi:hypothetical protein V8C34DRAFT_73706 [Trichoderma compactum]
MHSTIYPRIFTFIVTLYGVLDASSFRITLQHPASAFTASHQAEAITPNHLQPTQSAAKQPTANCPSPLVYLLTSTSLHFIASWLNLWVSYNFFFFISELHQAT